MKKISTRRRAMSRWLLLVNRWHPLPALSGSLCLAAPDADFPGVLLEARVAAQYRALMDAVGGWGRIAAVSGFRTMDEQRVLFAGALAEHGRAHTERFVALPGCSEHQTGLALDMALLGLPGGVDAIAPDFPDAGVCADFRAAAPRFGFVERYPRGAEHITGIGHEPWHFRFVGQAHAPDMAAKGLTLEEYTGVLDGRGVAT